MTFIIVLVLFFGIFGAIFYNGLRRKVFGVIGVGGSYLATIGIMCFVTLAISLFDKKSHPSVVDVLGLLVIGAACVAYLVYIMITRCNSVAQRVMLPFIALFIAFGFCERFLLGMLLKIPMGDGTPEGGTHFHERIIDNQSEVWELQHDSGDHAEYRCRKTGERVIIRYNGATVDYPTGWQETT